MRRRYFPLLVAFVAVLLALGSLGVGIRLDDYYIRWVICSSPVYSNVARKPSDAFRFVDGDPARNRRMIDAGLLPWWTDPHVKAAFWKPLTVLTHALDYGLWPGMPSVMHLQSLFWFGLWVLAACLLYRRIMRPTIAAALAGLLYAIDDARAVPVAWLANRNAVLAGLFGILAIGAHYRACRNQGRIFAVLSPLLLAMSLLSAETGIGTGGYLVALAITLDTRGWHRGLLRLWPHLLVVVAWRIAWSAQGYGVHAVDVLYTDPLGHPLAFVQNVIERLPLYILGQWTAFPAEVAMVLSPRGAALMWCGGVAVSALVVLIFLPLLRRSRVARFWGLGTLLAAIPMCSAAPMNRHLVFIGLGAMGLLGQFLAASLHRQFWRGSLAWRAALGTIVGLTVGIHLAIAPVAFAFIARNAPAPQNLLDSLHAIPLTPDRNRDLIFVNHPIPMEILDLLTARAVDHDPLPRHAQILAPASTAISVSRIDDRSLLVRPDGGFLSSAVSRLGYSGKYFNPSDEAVALPIMRCHVVETTTDGRPAKVLFHFNVPLEDASLQWLYWEDGEFRKFRPPAVGSTIRLPPSGLPF